jgi:hypothetical protein
MCCVGLILVSGCAAVLLTVIDQTLNILLGYSTLLNVDAFKVVAMVCCVLYVSKA